jgi:hypothetical protein
MTKSRLWLLAPVALMMTAPVVHAADASIKEVFAAARSGQVDKALEMMGPVLKDHPNSSKAHYLEAELLAHQHRFAEGRTELATAERLAPGLPGIQPQSVTALKEQLNGVVGAPVRREAPIPQASHGFSWMTIVLIGALVFAVLAIFRRRNRGEVYQPPVGGGYGAPGYGPQPGPMGGPMGGPAYGQGYGAPMGGGMGGGMGSGIMGGLATGAAAGVGMAAGERLIDGMFGGGHERSFEHEAPQQTFNPDDVNRDMGGNNFGISDDSSWDSSGGGSDDGGW